MDVHRDFCEVAILEGGRARSAGRVPSTPEQLGLFPTIDVISREISFIGNLVGS